MLSCIYSGDEGGPTDRLSCWKKFASLASRHEQQNVRAAFFCAPSILVTARVAAFGKPLSG
jgi:hypothetical protein